MSNSFPSLPRKPGVYLFHDSRRRVLYVGKAKDLRSRVKSYFRKTSVLDPRKAAMMGDVNHYSYIVTDNEFEAFVLEANLIKQHKPRFNVILRDDKNYPYLKLNIQHEWPGIEVVRRIKKDGALYFGPYVPASGLRDILAFIRRNFQIRDCRLPFDKPMKPCIRYQMRRCAAPCARHISREEYAKVIDEVTLFLRGEKKGLIDYLEKEMLKLSEEMKYEEAAGVRDRIRAVERSLESQKVISPELGDCDIIGCYRESDEVEFAVFFVRNGYMVGMKDFWLCAPRELSDAELFRIFIMQFYSGEIIPPDEILTPLRPDDAGTLEEWLGKNKGKKVRIGTPRRGRKKHLVDMAVENSRFAFRNRKDQSVDMLLREIRERLNLVTTPSSIGACDISTTAGDEAVGAFVYWECGAFIRERYRRLKIRTVVGMDDYAMMEELIGRIIEQDEGNVPDLLLIDGGKGHLEAARRVIEWRGPRLAKKVEVAAIAKDPDRAFVIASDVPINLDDKKRSSLLLKSIRDEVHGVAVGYHRKKRSRALLRSPLENIPGIGKKRRLELLRFFGSIENIKNATIDTIAGVKGFNRKRAVNLLKELGVSP